ncbi:unnamed protein product [Moneuplotes crassus]|uniref:Uncharacterized protein n=1 Tax=Euplotes crassus TaxID=5936 RepID=A0AAD1XWE0_EUPCR|nr:unnamed protein product [Moneuplotes crassus]
MRLNIIIFKNNVCFDESKEGLLVLSSLYRCDACQSFASNVATARYILRIIQIKLPDLGEGLKKQQ